MIPKSIFLRVVLVLLVLVVVAIGVIALNLDRIVKHGVEVYGPQITKVPITLDQVHIGLITASASVKNLVVGNPDGYKSPQAISVGDIAVGIDPLSILSPKIVVHSINIKSPEITFEGGLDGNNLTKILDNVNGSANSGGPVVTNSVGQPKTSKKFEVDDLVISGAVVNGNVMFFGKEIPIHNLNLPDIHLTNLGTGPDGITASDLISRVFRSLTTSTISAVASEATGLGNQVKNVGTKGATSLKSKLEGLFGK